jgi:hypothetical protein
VHIAKRLGSSLLAAILLALIIFAVIEYWPHGRSVGRRTMFIIDDANTRQIRAAVGNSPLGLGDVPPVVVSKPEQVRQILSWVSPGRSIDRQPHDKPVIYLGITGKDGKTESIEVYWTGKGPSVFRTLDNEVFVGPDHDYRDCTIALETLIRAIADKGGPN